MSSFIESSNTIVNIKSFDPTNFASGDVRNNSYQSVGVGSDIPNYIWVDPRVLDILSRFRGFLL